MTLNLRSYQREALEAVELSLLSHTRVAVVLPTGAGKTVLFAHLIEKAHSEGRKTLVLVHREELAEQAKTKIHSVAPHLSVGIVKAERNEVDADVIVASVQTLANAVRRESVSAAGDIGMVIVDECFPAGTYVGAQRIENIEVGDLVPSYNPETGDTELRPVTRVMKKIPEKMVRVTFEDGEEIACTPNHPFLTTEGWVPAGLLRGEWVVSFTHHADTTRDDLRALRSIGRADDEESHHRLAEIRADLLHAGASGRGDPAGVLGADGADEPEARFGTDDRQESDAPRGVSAEDGRDTETDPSPASYTWWQWRARDRAAAEAGRFPRLAHRGDGRSSGRGDALPLQGGHRASVDAGVRRGGRGIPFRAGPPSLRPTKGRETRIRRVADVQILERGSDGTYGGVCPDGAVYNLEVDTTHTYLIETGIVVHNCHHAVARTWMEVLAHFGCFDRELGTNLVPVDSEDGDWHEGWKATPCVGFTATLNRTDGKGLGDVWETVAYEKDILWMIDNGYLADVRGQQVTVDGLDLATIARSRGDYAEGQLGEALEASGAGEVIARAYREHASIEGTSEVKQGVIFAPTVHSAWTFHDAMNISGIPTSVIDGMMSSEDRALIYKRYEAGEIRVLANCMVLCLDTETEILTDRGWTRYDEMSYSHRVANWDQGAVFFKHPREIVVRDRGENEDMYVLETHRRSIRVTRGHRMVYRTFATGQWLKAPVEDLADRIVKLPTAGLAKPFVPVDLTLDEAALIGFWLGDGSTNRPSGGIEYTMSQSVRYPRIIQWVDDLLNRLGMDFRRYDKQHYKVPHIRWSLPRGTGFGPQARNGVQRIESYMNKRGSAALGFLDEHQFDALLTGLWYADGDHGQAENGRPDDFRIYGRLPLLEQVQAVAVVRGWTCSLRKETAPRAEGHEQVYRLSFSRRQQHAMGGTNPDHRIQREELPWRREQVWCVKTETRNIVTRRRGSVTVMGNTEGWDAPWAEVAVIARPTQSAALYTQMVGRVLRPWPGKTEALVLDVVGIAGRHKLQSLTDLVKTTVLNGESYAEARLRIEKENQIRMSPDRLSGALASKHVELFARSHSAWLQTRGGRWFISTRAGIFFLWPAEDDDPPGTWRLGFMKQHDRKRVSGPSWGQAPDSMFQREQGWIYTGLTLEYAMAHGEAMAEEDDPTVSLKDRSWRKTKPSQAQIDYAVRIKAVDPETAFSVRRGELSDLISVHLASRQLDR